MAQAPARGQLARRSPVELAVDRAWRFFCSVRAAVGEIVVLALLVLIGTLRGSSVPRWIADAVPFTESLVERWYAWDVFHSLPFMLNLAVIATAIAICTANRAPGLWRTIANPTVTTTRGFLQSAEATATVRAGGDLDDTSARLTAALRARRYRVLTARRGDELHLYADKNRYAKLGTFPFHLALILILVGGIVGARYGFRETEFVVPEGSVRPLGHGTDLSVRLDSFRETYREDGTAAEFRSDLTVLDGGDEVKSGSLTVNNPLGHGDTTFYQAGFGQAVDLQVTGPHGEPLFADAVPLGLYQARLNPDAPAGVLELPQAGAVLHLIAPDQNPANAPERDDLRLRSGELYVELRRLGPAASTPPVGAVVGQGGTEALGDLTVRFVRERRYTVLQVARNPGIPIFIGAALLLVAGLAVTFYFPHRRIRGILSPGGAGTATTALLAPLAKRDWSGQRDFDRLTADLAQAGLSVSRSARPALDDDATPAAGARTSPVSAAD